MENTRNSAVQSPPSQTSREPLVSIVLPTYNRAARLRTALPACLNQTYRNLEVIVVDDGSTDETPEIVKEFQARDSRLVYHRQQNQRLPRALNAGFRISRGQYLTWTSDDNAYKSNAVEVMVEALRKHPDVGLVYCDYDVVDESGNFVRTERLDGPQSIYDYCCVRACFMYRREVYETVGDYDPAWTLVEDYDYWLRAARHFKLLRVPGATPYTLTEHSESLTSQYPAKQALLTFKLQIKRAPRWRKVQIYLKTRKKAASGLAEQGQPLPAVFAGFLHACMRPWSLSRWLQLRFFWRLGHQCKSSATRY